MTTETQALPPPSSLKAISIGPAFVGKTALLFQLRTGTFDPNTETTLGCCCFQKTLQKDGTSITLTVWDTAGQERFNSITQMYYKGTAVALCVFDMTKAATLASLEDYIDKLYLECSSRAPPDIILVGNKSDLTEQREVSREQAEELAERHHCVAYIETSAKLGTGLKELTDVLTECAIQRRSKMGDEESSSGQDMSLEVQEIGKKKCC